MIDVKIFNVTVLMTNCCLLTDRKTGKMAVTDPGAPNEELNSEIEKNGGKLEYVILTSPDKYYTHFTDQCLDAHRYEQFSKDYLSFGNRIVLRTQICQS